VPKVCHLNFQIQLEENLLLLDISASKKTIDAPLATGLVELVDTQTLQVLKRDTHGGKLPF
jgi:hypothetical protein